MFSVEKAAVGRLICFAGSRRKLYAGKHCILGILFVERPVCLWCLLLRQFVQKTVLFKVSFFSLGWQSWYSGQAAVLWWPLHFQMICRRWKYSEKILLILLQILFLWIFLTLFIFGNLIVWRLYCVILLVGVSMGVMIFIVFGIRCCVS